MPHPRVENRTPFAVDFLAVNDEEGRPNHVVLVQGTYGWEGTGEPLLLDEQPAIAVAGAWHGAPGLSSLLHEPQIAIEKPGTDVLVHGHVHAAALDRSGGLFGVRVGTLIKTARIVGNRRLVRRGGSARVSGPEPFETMPLIYERAFGGWDRTAPIGEEHRPCPGNPIGTGFRLRDDLADDDFVLPNIEDPTTPYGAYGDQPPPTGFGPIGPDWQPRAGFGGTYDDAWSRTRQPLLPVDFDRRFLQAASPGLSSTTPLLGDEPVSLIGVGPSGRADFRLPGAVAPTGVVVLRGNRSRGLQMRLDTVTIDLNRGTVMLLWRAHVAVRHGPHDVLANRIG